MGLAGEDRTSAAGRAALWLVVAVALGAPHVPRSRGEPRILEAARSVESREYRLKAAYLYNFASLTSWPAEAFDGPQAPIVIGVLGEDPFGRLLEEGFRGRRVGRRGFRIERYSDLEALGACHLLYVTPTVEDFAAVAARTRREPVLVVTEDERALGRGSLIDLYIADKTVRFAVQVDEVRRSGLEISSKLLKLARIVRDGEEGR